MTAKPSNRAAVLRGPLGPGVVVENRYRVESLIGQGGMGSVYLATDEGAPDGPRRVALKVHTGGGGTASLRFLREFRAIARLKHPYCLAVHDYGSWRGLPYFTMEYVSGGLTFRSLLTEPLDLGLSVVARVAAALDHVHGQGIVHRDLKPGNVLLSPRAGPGAAVSRDGDGDGAADGHALVPKLADFGLAVDRSAEAEAESDEPLTRAGFVVGTPEYMAPEQVLGLEVDARADLYSLGCLVFELVSGRLPFGAKHGVDGPSAFELMKRKVETAPEPPEPRDPRAAALAPAILRLLATDPADRYPTAADFVAELADLFPAAVEGLDAEAPGAAPSSGVRRAVTVFRPRLVNRAVELEALEQALTRALDAERRPETPVVAVPIRGAGGAGKSRLIEELCRHARNRGLRVIALAATPGSGPYDLGRAMLSRLAGGRLAGPAADLDRFARSLGEAAGEGSVSGVVAGAAAASDRAERDRNRFLHDAAAAFAAVLADGPTVLALDDLHALDRASKDLVAACLHAAASLARESDGRAPRVLVALGYRPEETGADHPLTDLLAELAAIAGVETRPVDVGPLGSGEVLELVASALGERPPAPGTTGSRALPQAGGGAGAAGRRRGADALTPLGRAIFDASAGSPLFALEALKELAERGDVARGRGGIELDEAALRELPLPRAVRDAVGARTSRLEAEARAVLDLASALGREFDPEVLLAASGRPRNELADVLGELVRHRLVEESPDDPSRLRFVHDGVRAAAYAALGEDVRKDAHDRLADALEASGAGTGGASPTDPAQVAEHRLRGRAPGRAVPALLAAADRARARFAFADAGRLLGLVLEAIDGRAPGLAPLGPERVDALRELLGDLRSLDLDRDGAVRCYEAVLPRATDPLVRARLWRKTGRAQHRAFDHRAAVAALERGLAELGVRLPSTRLGVLLSVGRSVVRRFFRSIHWFLLQPPTRSADFGAKGEIDPRARERIELLGTIGEAYHFLDLERMADAHLRRVRDVRLTLDPVQSLRALAEDAGMLATIGFVRIARKSRIEAERLALRMRDPWAEALALTYGGVCDYAIGRRRDAAEATLRGERLAEASGDLLLAFYARSVAWYSLTPIGELRRAEQVCERQVEGLAGRDSPALLSIALGQRARVKLALGEVEAALADTDRQQLLCAPYDALILRGGAAYMRGETCLAAGRVKEGVDWLETAYRLASASRARTVLTLVHMMRYSEVVLDLACAGQPVGPTPKELLRAAREARRQAVRFPNYHTLALKLKALEAAYQGRMDEAAASFEDALVHATAEGEWLHALEVLRARAAFLERVKGKGAGAADRERAERLHRDMCAP